MELSSSVPSPAERPLPSAAIRLLPLLGIVFLGYMSVGMPLPVLPILVRNDLGYSAVTVGWVVGLQSVATVLTRQLAGNLCDTRGPRVSVLAGLPLASVAGITYLAAALLPAGAAVSLAVLAIGRLLHGMAESLFLTGSMAWGIARLGPQNTGKVMAWQGIAIYAALGLGSPIGIAILGWSGFQGVALATLAIPAFGLTIAWLLAGVSPHAGGARLPFYRVLGLIWRPGMALALGTVPFAALAGFVALDFAQHHWDGAGFAIGGFAAGYIAVRLRLAGLPDRIGGGKVAAGSLLIQAAGQLLMWLAGSPWAALLGATITGIGFSLVFPSMGVEAVRRVPAQNRGAAAGGFVAFFDLALGLGGPAVGVVAAGFGYADVFLLGAVASLAAIGLALSIRRVVA